MSTDRSGDRLAEVAQGGAPTTAKPVRSRRERDARRRAVQDLRARGLTLAQIGQRLGMSEATASRLNREPIGQGSHNAQAEGALAPLREHHARELACDFPDLDDRRRAILADKLARIECAAGWLDTQGTVVADPVRGETFPVVDRLESWTNVAWRLLEQAGQGSGRRAAPAQALIEHVHETYAARAERGGAARRSAERGRGSPPPAVVRSASSPGRPAATEAGGGTEPSS